MKMHHWPLTSFVFILLSTASTRYKDISIFTILLTYKHALMVEQFAYYIIPKGTCRNDVIMPSKRVHWCNYNTLKNRVEKDMTILKILGKNMHAKG